MDEFWQSCDDSAFNLISGGGDQSTSATTFPSISTNTQPVVTTAQPEPSGASISKNDVQQSDDLKGAVAALTTAPESGQADPVLSDKDEERDRILCLLSHFDRDQLDRYEVFRRGAFPKSVIRMIMQTVSGRPASQNAVIAMAGITKVYVGEIVEEALRVKNEQLANEKLLKAASNNEGKTEFGEKPQTAAEEDKRASEPLKPSHIYEAVRRLSDKIVPTRPQEFRL